MPACPVQATRTVTRQTLVATLVMVVVTVNWASPDGAVQLSVDSAEPQADSVPICPDAQTYLWVHPAVTVLQQFMMKDSRVWSSS